MALSNIGGLASGIGAIFDLGNQKKAINNATYAQEVGAGQAANQVLDSRDRQRMQFQPYYDVGYSALQNLHNAVGGNGQAGKDWVLNNFRNFDPGYQYRVDESLRGLEANANAAGGRLSGGELMSLQDRAGNLADQNYGNYLNQLTGLAGMGQTATAQTGALDAASSQNLADIYTYRGDAKAAGSIARGNANSNALSQIGGLFGFLS
jgi:hypothetical protein